MPGGRVGPRALPWKLLGNATGSTKRPNWSDPTPARPQWSWDRRTHLTSMAFHHFEYLSPPVSPMTRLSTLMPMDVDVFPDFGGVGGASDLRSVIGALLTFVLITAVLMLIVCAIAWGIASAHGNYHTATKARTGLLVAVGAAALAGVGVTWVNWLIDLGNAL